MTEQVAYIVSVNGKPAEAYDSLAQTMQSCRLLRRLNPSATIVVEQAITTRQEIARIEPQRLDATGNGI